MGDDLSQFLSAWNQMKGEMAAAPAASADPWAQARAEFPAVGGQFPPTPGKAPYVESATGKIMYENGVIVDMTTGQLVDGAWQTDANIEGSRAWLIAIQKDWSDAKADTWRKRLSDMGYIPEGGLAESGGMAIDLVNSLKLYYTTKYLNGGTAPRMSPKATKTEAIRKSFDPVMVKESVKEWGSIPFDDPLDDDTASYFADRVMDLAVKLAQQHPTWTGEQVQSGAEIRAQREFVQTPGVKGALRDEEDDEMDESLREQMVSISQLNPR